MLPRFVVVVVDLGLLPPLCLRSHCVGFAMVACALSDVLSFDILPAASPVTFQLLGPAPPFLFFLPTAEAA